MYIRKASFFLLISIVLFVTGCIGPSEPVTELKHFPLDSNDSIITKSGVSLDIRISSDGKGSLRIDAAEPLLVRLLEINNIDVENASLIYQARLRTKDLDGQAYLEMWCGFAGKGEFFSRSLKSPLAGTNEWTTVETPFYLEQGQNPDLIKLNLVVDGKGTVWIDEVKILKGPLN